MPFHIFRIRTVAGANISALLLGASLFANFFLLTLYVQEVLGWSALKTGLTFIATAGSAVLWAGVAQALVTRFGAKPIMIDRLRRDDRRDALVHADPGPRRRTGATCCRATCSSASRSRSRSFPSRSPRSRESSTHEAGLASGIYQHRAADRRRDRRRRGLVRVDQPLQPPHALHGRSHFPQAFTSGTQWGFWVMRRRRRSSGCSPSLVLVRRDELATGRDGGAGARRPDGVGFPADGARVSDRPRPGRRHPDRPARPRISRDVPATCSRSSST